MDLNQLASVREIADQSPFTEPTLRWWLFNREENGLARAVVKVGRRLYLDKHEFTTWLEGQRAASDR